ncbi:hypothetical protein [Demetria terragena]|uniref:hypothetical protein n=1 Tax=Demetria terragena TaxID=63959 RepID=UPI0012EAA8AA|nr:hypothetical protein [Demetria terragena]
MLHISTYRPAAALALGLSAAVTLTGCGLLGDDEGGGSPSSAANSPSTPGSAASSTPAPSGSEQSSSEGQQTRPSKADVAGGLKSFYDRTDKANTFNHDKMANCIADKSYDTLSATSLNAMKDGDPSKLDRSDSGAFTGISIACMGQAAPSGQPSLPSIPSEFPTAIPTDFRSSIPTLPKDIPSKFPTAPST